MLPPEVTRGCGAGVLVVGPRPSLVNQPPSPTMRPHQRRQQEHQLEPKATAGHGHDVVTALNRCAIKQLACDTGSGVAELDARF